jgi:hypothetical protein
MRFFEPPPRQGKHEAEPRLPSWFHPPPNEIGQTVALNAIVARSDRCIIAVSGVVVYSLGFELQVRLRLRDVVCWIDPLGDRRGFPEDGRENDRLADDLLRMGIEFADGRKATSTDDFRRPDEAAPAAYFQVSGGGGGGLWDFTCWIWPLPSNSPTTFVVEWPALGIQLTRYELPTDPMLQASKQSLSIWED